ncbi:hypothetical protein [Bradyrhizobium sp. BRP23]|uniref:hypothetical protein n=1 Tax=Bradyrhizobium sp. BRP23 TaxID=2793820 RepID=UPI001CD44FF3|nr:hypothetical protein [Bradyrhizobium sp. BRP23]MCA1381208.1 hypothetical protein [Bradyrhizobium sp. BRP05]MCA1418671.1 hypothetical protein [Bradyrhizobium sp. BRP23]
MQIDSMTIELLAELRDQVNARLSQRGADRQRGLSSQAERLGALIASQCLLDRLLRSRKGENTGSGRGSKPAWVNQHLALGGTLAELEVRP